MHNTAKDYFDANDKHIDMDAGQKATMFDEAMAEFKRSIKLAKSKFSIIDTKMDDVKQFTKDVHLSTDRLEKLYLKDIEKRKKYFHEHEKIVPERGPDLDLTSVDDIFDQIEAEENIPPMLLMLKLQNLMLLGVIFMCSFVIMQLNNVGNKNRVD